MKTLETYTLDVELHIFLVDKKSIQVNELHEAQMPNVRIHEIEDLELGFLGDMVLRYGILELNTAVKPFCFSWLFKKFDYKTICYLDPDICVYSPLIEVEEFSVSTQSILLTPHSTRPIQGDLIPNDYHFLQSGAYNLGFLGINNNFEGIQFLNWWESKLKDKCIANFSLNLFTDQKWCDLIPSYFPGHKILRHEGYNLAYWNLDNRKVHHKNDKYFVNDDELQFIHFSGLDIPNLKNISKHQNQFEWNQVEELQNLAKSYVHELILNSWLETRNLDYYYSQTASGKNIFQIYRNFFNSRFPNSINLEYSDLDHFLSNFVSESCNHFDVLSISSISEFQHWLWLNRADLNSAFDLSTRHGAEKYLEWFDASFEREYGQSFSISSRSRKIKSTIVFPLKLLVKFLRNNFLIRKLFR
jgi:hypothetical protein